MNTEFTDELKAAMNQLPAPVPPGIVPRARRRYRRRRATLWAAAAAGTGAVTGLAVVLAGVTGPASRTITPVNPMTVSVVSHVTTALDSLAPSTILFDRTTYLHPDSGLRPSFSWSTVNVIRNQQFTETGQLAVDESLTETATTTTHLIVDYQRRSWEKATTVLPPESASPSAPPPSCASGVPDGWSADPHEEAAMLRTAVSCGALTAVNGGIVDGVSTIELSEQPGATTMTYWVDATTYLPVRIIQVWANAPYSSGNLQMDLQWLPATPANKAKLTVPIPPGFTHTPWGS